MRETPETDALISVGLENADRECIPAEFGRKLERERDEAMEQNVKLRDIADTAIEYVGHTSVQQKLRDELKQETPQTDAAVEDTILHDRNHPRIDWVPASFARKLERERDEAQFLLKSAQSALDAIYLEVGGWIKTMKENTD
jgi:hypothetical protein